MGLLQSMLKQEAVYWEPAGFDDHGRPHFTDVTPVVIKCRWEDRMEQYTDKDGREAVSQSIVYVDRDVKLGGVLIQIPLDGVMADVVEDESDPFENDNAFEIKALQRLPKKDPRKGILRTVWL